MEREVLPPRGVLIYLQPRNELITFCQREWSWVPDRVGHDGAGTPFLIYPHPLGGVQGSEG